jgi:hypothetical protein
MTNHWRHICYKTGDGRKRQKKAIMAGIEDTPAAEGTLR